MLEHDYEPVPGLPQSLPGGERMLWQGRAGFASLARGTFRIRGLLFYFALLLALRATLSLRDGGAVGDILVTSAGLASLAAIAIGLLLLYAWLLARSTLYTITNRRLVVRSGVALPVTTNLPFSRIDSAELRLHRDGSGDIAILPDSGSRASYVLLWPFVKPLRLLRVRPVLRGIRAAADVAALLADALSTDIADASARRLRAAGGESPPAPDARPRRRFSAYPTVPLTAAVSLVAITVVAVAIMRYATPGPADDAAVGTVAAVDLYFEDRDDGSVAVIDAASGDTIEQLEPGSNGFVRGALRSVVRARRAVGAGADVPFSLRLTEAGRLLLHDPATGREIDLWAFGRSNAEAFGRLLDISMTVPVAGAGIEDHDDDRRLTAVVPTRKETLK